MRTRKQRGQFHPVRAPTVAVDPVLGQGHPLALDRVFFCLADLFAGRAQLFTTLLFSGGQMHVAVLGADAGEDALGAAHPFEVDAGALGVREEIGAGGFAQRLQVLGGDVGFGGAIISGMTDCGSLPGFAGLGNLSAGAVPRCSRRAPGIGGIRR